MITRVVLDRIKRTDATKLQDEYAKLVEGLQESITTTTDEDTFMTNPGKWYILCSYGQPNVRAVLPDDLLKEAIPGNIRKAEHFVAFLKRFVEYLKASVSVIYVVEAAGR